MNTESLAAGMALMPLVAFFVVLVLRRYRGLAMSLSLIGSGLSLCAAILLFIQGPRPEPILFRWLTISGNDVTFGILLDSMNLMMGLVVTGVSFLIQVYSIGYMGHDEGRSRYFAFLSLFTWAMLSFVFATSLLQTFIFWELVGLSSFLLIGFWYQKKSAVLAARKAFIMTRIGDVGLFIGMILLFETTGTLDIMVINASETIMGIAPGRLEVIAGLLFIGIIGKSAQFPLHTWLPDAMEGPTPVSALLHSATMVAAGVYLFARFHPIFMAAEATLSFVLGISAFTAVLAATMAMVATDIKKVLAYSSISQLGYMLMALAAGGLFAGFFHLTTHAIFKALLFLCAGAYIHHYGTNDLVAIGRAGGRKKWLTTLGLIVGGAALAGLPPFAGFFSKEAVLISVGQANQPVVLGAAYLAALLTSYYTFRVIFLILCPNAGSAATVAEGDEPSHGHGEEGATAMGIPILLLSCGAIGLGFLGTWFADYLRLPMVHGEITDLVPAVAVGLAGVLWAWMDFGRKSAPQTGAIVRLPGLHRLFANRWFIDGFYNRVVVACVDGCARICQVFEEKGIDRTGDQLGKGALDSGVTAARWHSGSVQLYIGTAIAMVAVFVVYLGLR